MGLKTKDLVKALKAWRIHIEVQFLSLGFCPVMFYVVVLILCAAGAFKKSDPLAQGLLVLGCLPTTVSSAVVISIAST
jgi:predicted Na+-dependent transporter